MKTRASVLFWIITASLLSCSMMACPPVDAGSFDARRIAMGGVMLSEYGEAQSRNVALRAVPAGKTQRSIPIPLGIIQVLTSLPEFDPEEPDFNAFEIAELVTNFPVFLRIVEPETVSDDIVMDVAKNRLAIDLGDLAEVVPEEPFKLGGLLDQPNFSYGVGGFFGGLSGLLVGESDFSLSSSLSSALRGNRAFLPNTDYHLKEEAEVQATAVLGFGYARRLNALIGGGEEDPRRSDELAVYGGGRFKYLVGLAYAKVDPVVSFTTGDVIFGDEPLDMHFQSTLTTALPVGSGTGLDLGVAMFKGGYEVGLGIVNVATKIHWKADRELHVLEDSTNEVVKYTLAEDADYTSTVPSIVLLNAARRWGTNTLAFDIEKGISRTTFHLGFESIQGKLALRTGTWLDANGKLQFAGGTGFKVGFLNLDMALMTSSSVLTKERAVDLALSFSI
ncbi:MAG: hypothetical protein AMJ46_05290 [Latescibacteria bacterium DG_63]|nr:MAG: hypothetical protein AMJ46_05290 [Latescibacteria bacterium DG_63]